MNWQVLYVKSRAEKKVANRLEARGISSFCPLRTEVRQWSDRKKKVQVPYFPSYVFVCLDQRQSVEVLQTPGVVGYMYWLGKPAIIRTEEMEEVVAFFNTQDEREITCKPFEIGQRMRIKEGPLKTQRGIVLRQNKNKVVLQIEQLGVVFIAEISKNRIEAD